MAGKTYKFQFFGLLAVPLFRFFQTYAYADADADINPNTDTVI